MDRRLAAALVSLTVLLALGPGVPVVGDRHSSAWIGIDAATAATKPKARKDAAREPLPEKKPAAPAASPAADGPSQSPAEAAAPAPAPLPPERVEADVSTRSVAVTSAFRGTEIVVFGSVDNSRQTSAESGYYDIVVVVEGQPAPLTVRRKGNVAGLWINTAAAKFEAVPSYYAFASTRPIEEVTEPDILAANLIGFENVRMRPAPDVVSRLIGSDLRDYREAIIRLKQEEGLYVRADYGVAFIGRSLFRSQITLPSNIPVAALTARVYLFREGELLSRYTARVTLERKGIELLLYDFAQTHPFFYGSLAIVLALGCGFAASAILGRQLG